MSLTAEEKLRYARHLSLPMVGLEGQEKLQRARVLCIGAGGLGSPLLMYLAAAGVGHLGIVDFDCVDASNLQRQVIHGTESVGHLKAESARQTIQRLNPHVEVTIHPVRLDRHNALEILGPYDIVADGTDNFPTRYLVNDACALLRKPWVYGSVFQFEGQASFFHPAAQGPCYRCLFPEPPAPGTVPSCAEGGVFGVLPGIIGCIQATEIIKFILGQEGLLLGRLLSFQALEMKFREIRLRKDPHCPLCGTHPTITELIDYEQFCGVAPKTSPFDVTPDAMRAALAQPAPHLVVLDIREEWECVIEPIPGAVQIPMSQLEARLGELDPQQTIYVCCQHGLRSQQVVGYLRANGFTQAKNVLGGLAACHPPRSL